MTVIDFNIDIAGVQHLAFVADICQNIENSAKERGTGVAKRSETYIQKKILDGNAIVATTQEDTPRFAGFCYIETWGHGKYVANSGLIVAPAFRKYGLARLIKKHIFDLSIDKFPGAKIFGITTSLPVMRINTSLGYVPVTFSELTTDDDFWKGCSSCVNYDVLTRTNRKMCLCTGMSFDPEKMKPKQEQTQFDKVESKKPEEE